MFPMSVYTSLHSSRKKFSDCFLNAPDALAGTLGEVEMWPVRFPALGSYSTVAAGY